jgi:hypothetical protein
MATAIRISGANPPFRAEYLLFMDSSKVTFVLDAGSRSERMVRTTGRAHRSGRVAGTTQTSPLLLFKFHATDNELTFTREILRVSKNIPLVSWQRLGAPTGHKSKS